MFKKIVYYISFKKYIIIFIKFYQRAFSYYSAGCCRFVPTCSNFAIGAIERFGVIRGCILIIKRLLRCNIFSKQFGYDPVPIDFKFFNFRNKKY